MLNLTATIAPVSLRGDTMSRRPLLEDKKAQKAATGGVQRTFEMYPAAVTQDLERDMSSGNAAQYPRSPCAVIRHIASSISTQCPLTD